MNDTKPCVTCGAVDHDQQGRCLSCLAAHQAAVPIAERPCPKCGVLNRNARGECRPCVRARKAARVVALKDKTCPKCGATGRYSSNGQCRPCGDTARAARKDAHAAQLSAVCKCPPCTEARRLASV